MMMNSTAHPIRILMVDDEPLIAQLVVDVLTTEGYEVDTAASGLLALDRIEEGSYDLILSDLRMPDLDGFAFYHELERRRPDLVRRMIFISGTTEHPEYQKFLDEAGVPMLSKPFHVEDLCRLAEQSLAGAQT